MSICGWGWWKSVVELLVILLPERSISTFTYLPPNDLYILWHTNYAKKRNFNQDHSFPSDINDPIANWNEAIIQKLQWQGCWWLFWQSNYFWSRIPNDDFNMTKCQSIPMHEESNTSRGNHEIPCAQKGPTFEIDFAIL